MRKLVLIVLMLLGVAAPPATAAELILPADTPYPFQEWAATSKAPLPPGPITVLVQAGGCGGEGNACTGPGSPIVFDTEYGFYPTRWDFRHELGHHFDYTLMPDWARARFQELVGDYRPWTADPNAPNEKFAEAWTWCSMAARLRRVPPGASLGYGYTPYPRLHRQACHLIWNVAT